MMKKILMMVLGIILMVNMASAVVQYSQTDLFPFGFNHTTRNHASLFWIQGKYEGIIDYISDDELLEVKVDYSMYPQTWNNGNPDHQIVNCTFYVSFFEHLLNNSYILYNETVTPLDSDVLGASYFVRLKNRDGFTADIDCYFENDYERILDSPTELTIVTPSYECKACQYYEWTLLQRDIAKAKVIGDNTVSVWDYVREVIDLNFEVIVALFWFLLIIILLMGGGLIFIGIYWMFTYLRGLAKEI